MSGRARTLTAMALAAVALTSACAGAPAAPAPKDAAPVASAPVVTSVSTKLAHAVTSLEPLNGTSAVAIGLADGQVMVWNGHDQTPAIVLKPHAARVLAVASGADGRDVWSIATDGTVARTPAAAGATSTTINVALRPGETRLAAFARDAAWLVTGGEFGELRVFDLPSGALRHELKGHRTEIQALAVRPGTASIASASAESDLRIWDVMQGKELRLIESDLSLFAVAFSPRGDVLVSGGVDRRITWRDPASWATTAEMTLRAPRMVGSIAWSPDGRFLAMGDIDDETLSKGGIQVIDAATRAIVATLDTGNDPAMQLAFVNGSTIVAASGPNVRSWSTPLAVASSR